MSFNYSTDVFTTIGAKSPLESAFAQESAKNAINSLINEFTDNGDLTFGSTGTTPSAALLELDQHMVRHVPRTSRGKKHLSPSEYDITPFQRSMLDSDFDTFFSRVVSLPVKQQSIWWSLMFRYIFFLRNLRGEGKRERNLFYYLFDKVNSVYPKTAEALVELIPDFGYFGDLDYLITTYPESSPIHQAAINCYIKYLDADCMQLFGKAFGKVSVEDASTLNDKLRKMSNAELAAFTKGKRFSLASKWFAREGKTGSDYRVEVINKVYFSHGGFSDIRLSNPDAYRKRMNYSMMRLRNVITALSTCTKVGEQMMCASESALRNWSSIDMEHSPAGFVTKYRKALLNESLTEGLASHELDTGNRSKRPDRIQCRKNTLAAILEGKLKGAQQDLSKLCDVVCGYVTRYGISSSLTFGERSLINQQWQDIVKSVKEMIQEVVAENTDNPDFIDPRNVIPIVDTSGSMSTAGVQNKAIGLGLLATAISTMPGCLISFSDTPEVFKVDLTKDVFNQFLTIYQGPMGYNTNIDATYRLLLDLMVKSKTPKVNFAMLVLTDGQFDRNLVTFDGAKAGYDAQKYFENVFLGRMEKAFTDKGYTLPRTIFWNLVGTGRGFCAAETTKGVQMVSGFSQTLMKQVFTGEFKLVVDEVTGATRVDVDPWASLLKVITSERFDSVLHTVLKTQEGAFKGVA